MIIRAATLEDVPTILRLIVALAVHEREPDAVKATEDSLRATLFGPDARVFVFLAEHDGAPVGLALWFLTYSTWSGRPTLYLEDLYVDDSARGAGVGLALMRRLAREARALGCARIDWAVLDWNVDAMAFYRRAGARAQTGWQPWRLDGEALEQLMSPGEGRGPEPDR